MALFLVADTHFDDENAIDYHIRPYQNTDEMNEVMAHNWNRVVSYDDTVLVLGDFSGPDVSVETTADWASILNGKKIFVQGNNDSLSPVELNSDDEIHDNYQIKRDGYEFFCTHKPEDTPENWHGWTIHGHSHQLHPKDYPHYSYQNKRVNVSVEQIGYTPVSLSAIVNMVDIISE